MIVFLNKFLIILGILSTLLACQNESKMNYSESNKNLEPGGYMYFFEQGVSKSIDTSSSQLLTLNSEHYKDGKNSLEWSFDPNSQLSFKQDIRYENEENEARPYTFMAWIYNDIKTDEYLTFNFQTDDSINTSFKYHLNFKGWRGISVPFQDMDGSAVEGMNKLVINAPSSQGKILLDQIMMSVPVDHRWPLPDYQQPFVNPKVTTMPSKNWSALLMYDQKIRTQYNSFNFGVDFNDTHGNTASIYNNFDKYLAVNSSDTVTQQEIEKNIYNYKYFKISYNRDGSITGAPLDHPKRQNFFKTDILSKKTLTMLTDVPTIRKLGKIMLVTAKYLRIKNLSAENRAALENVFIDATRYILDQGWVNGSGFQIITHVGYQTREIFDAWFISRRLLATKGLIEPTQQAMMWFNATGRIYEEDDEIKSSNVDILNTQLSWMIKSILLLPDENEREELLVQLQSWLSKTLLSSDGLGGGFKPDGSVFHHSQHYTAYAKDALNGLSISIYGLSGSPYQISKAAHQRAKEALLKMRIYSKETNMPIILSGRHPDGLQKISSAPFKWMALSGSPDGTEQIDQELAGAYANLSKKNQFESIPAESEPTGTWAMNYASMAIIRRESLIESDKSWLAIARGFSRYLVGNETYKANNLYGRYLQYGQLEITPSNFSKRAFSHDGWDWNRYPGTTTIHLPNDELRAVLNQLPSAGIEEMLLSTESYSGANTLDKNNAMFAMKLHGHKKYEQQSFRALKSYFIFQDSIIALGSGIKNDDGQHETETTLFQHSVPNLEPAEVDELPISTIGTNLVINSDVTFLDPAGNRYFFTDSENEQVSFTYQSQQSNDEDNGKETNGKFVTAVIEHGKAPQDGQYEYAIKVEAQDTTKPVYTILQHNNKVHAVRSIDNIEAYAFFEPVSLATTGYIISSNTPSQIMLKNLDSEQIQLSIVNPDLAIYEGQDIEQIDENGEQIEVSIYDRPWRFSESQRVKTAITIKGHWRLYLNNSNVQAVLKGDNTEVTVTTIDAIPEVFILNLI